jgi:hypothetical protein
MNNEQLHTIDWQMLTIVLIIIKGDIIMVMLPWICYHGDDE